MPYIKPHQRHYFAWPLERLKDVVATATPGELNYLLTEIVKYWVLCQNEASYSHLNTAVGVLECVKQEFYRRLAVPYEDKKAKENGDVYRAPSIPDLFDDAEGPDHGSHSK